MNTRRMKGVCICGEGSSSKTDMASDGQDSEGTRQKTELYTFVYVI